jgi:peptidyl-prolyl cis-trans isomerase C
MMKLKTSLLILAAALPLAAAAQNVAIVNGKPVPKARVDMLLKQVEQQAARGGQQLPPDLETRAREEVVRREVYAQEAEKRGIPASADYKAQMEIARQSLLINMLWLDYEKKNPVSDADAKAEYDKFKAQTAGAEYRARHILVETEETAKKLIADIKAGAKFEDVAKKNSKDPGSAENGGDLDFAKPDAYVPEFGQAMTALKKGEMTEAPVKTQFGYHIIKLDDTREAQFPAFEEVKPQIQQRLAQTKLQQYQDGLRSKAKTDFQFSGQ